MSPAAHTFYRLAVVDWLAPGPGPVLDLASGSQFADGLATHQPSTTIVTVASSAATGPHVVGRAESLPFAPRTFATVTAVQSLHRFDAAAALAEAARVLRPEGHLAVSYAVRDDSVPWVRRFAALVRAYDPGSMRGQWGEDSIEALANSPYFHPAAEHAFASWIPATRDQLISMVMARPAIRVRDATDRAELADAVGELYDATARHSQLVLPYRVHCWRAQVNSAEVPHTPHSADEPLHIWL